jgi:hypothetical protein
MEHKNTEGSEDGMQNVPKQQTFAELAVDHVAPWSPNFPFKLSPARRHIISNDESIYCIFTRKNYN